MVGDLVYFSFSQLFKHGVHLGLQSTLLHSSMLKYLLPVNYLNFTLFNLNFAYASLRLISNFIITMNSMRKPSLVINSVSFLDDFLVDFFSGLNQPVSRGLWVSGRLTNFRFVRQSSVRRFYLHKIIIKAFARIESMGLSNSSIRNIMNRTFNPIRYKQSVFRHVMNLTRMPRFCFINDSTINAVSVNECFILNIPSICSVDSGSSNIWCITYPIPGNSVSLASVLLYYSIHKYSIQRGIYKERYLFILKSLKAKINLYGFLQQQPVSVQKINSRIRLPFLKVKLCLNLVMSSFSKLLDSYRLSSTYAYLLTINLRSFKKLAKKYLLIVRTFALYGQYLFNHDKKYSVFGLLNNKLSNYLLLASSSDKVDIRSTRTLDFLQLGDLIVATIFRDIFNKPLFIKQPALVYLSSDLFFNRAHNNWFLALIKQFIEVFHQFKIFKFNSNNLLYYTFYISKEVRVLFSNVDIFNNNFFCLYKKLFLFFKKTIKLQYFKYKTLFHVAFLSAFPINQVNTLLLWISLFKNFSKLYKKNKFMVINYIPKTNLCISNTEWLSIKTILGYSYSLFYKSLSLNYRNVKPFILNFTRIKNNFFIRTKIRHLPTMTFKTKKRRW